MWKRKQWVAILGVALLAGCASSPPQQGSRLSDSEMKSLVEKTNSQDPYLRSQTDVSLDVSRIGSTMLQITIANKTKQVLTIGPENFAILIPGSERQMIKANALASHQSFPVVQVNPGDQASGQVVFPPEALLSGKRLVFSNPKCAPAMAALP